MSDTPFGTETCGFTHRPSEQGKHFADLVVGHGNPGNGWAEYRQNIR
jgi:hypothetical protein